MTTQVLEVNATTGQAFLARVYALGSDTPLATVAAVEKSNDKGRYRVTLTDLDLAGPHRVNFFIGAAGGFANEIFDLTNTDATFYPRSESSSPTTIWGHASRTLTSFGSLVSNIVSAIQEYLFGNGAFAIGIRVSNGAGGWVQNALVRVAKDGVSRVAYSDSNGWVNFSLDSGTWQVSATASSFSYTPSSIVVSASGNFQINLTPATIPNPSAPGLCNVLFAVMLNATPVQNARVTLTLDPNSTTDGIVQATTRIVGFTASNGQVTLEMVRFEHFTRGGVYLIEVEDPNGETIMSVRRKVPALATCTAEDLLPE